jgi:uncharacterized membrane protein YhaH (DUF805 family)
MAEPATPARANGLGFGPAWAWLFAPDGRMGRVDYFYAVFARAVVIVLPLALLPEGMDPAVPVWTIAVILTAGGPTVRRLHDLGRSGLHAPWLCFALVLGCALNYQLPRPLEAATAIFYILSWTPYLLALALMLWPGEKNDNRYGPPPA